jgi:hypothetical protein
VNVGPAEKAKFQVVLFVFIGNLIECFQVTRISAERGAGEHPVFLIPIFFDRDRMKRKERCLMVLSSCTFKLSLDGIRTASDYQVSSIEGIKTARNTHRAQGNLRLMILQ